LFRIVIPWCRLLIIIYVDIETSNKWLTNADLFAETEGFLTAIQDHVILTRNYKKDILKQSDTEELYRRCGKESETVQHITAACEQLAATEYVKRHDGLAKIIHQKLVIIIIIIIILLLLLFTIGLSPGDSGYFTCIQNMKLITNKS